MCAIPSIVHQDTGLGPRLPWKWHGAHCCGLPLGRHSSDISHHISRYFSEPIQARNQPWFFRGLEALSGATDHRIILHYCRGFHPLSLRFVFGNWMFQNNNTKVCVSSNSVSMFYSSMYRLDWRCLWFEKCFQVRESYQPNSCEPLSKPLSRITKSCGM